MPSVAFIPFCPLASAFCYPLITSDSAPYRHNMRTSRTFFCQVIMQQEILNNERGCRRWCMLMSLFHSDWDWEGGDWFIYCLCLCSDFVFACTSCSPFVFLQVHVLQNMHFWVFSMNIDILQAVRAAWGDNNFKDLLAQSIVLNQQLKSHFFRLWKYC